MLLLLSPVFLYLKQQIDNLEKALKDINVVSDADYIIFRDENKIYARNGSTLRIELEGNDASTIIETCINRTRNGGNIYVKPGDYILTKPIRIITKSYFTLRSDGAQLINNQNDFAIKVVGCIWNTSISNSIHGFRITSKLVYILFPNSGGVLVQDSFSTKIENCEFNFLNTSIMLQNYNSWTENTQIKNCRFLNVNYALTLNVLQGGNGTKSFSYTSLADMNISLDWGISDKKLIYISHYEFMGAVLQNVHLWSRGDNTLLFLNSSNIDRALFLNISHEQLDNSSSKGAIVEIGNANIGNMIFINLRGWNIRNWIYNPYDKPYTLIASDKIILDGNIELRQRGINIPIPEGALNQKIMLVFNESDVDYGVMITANWNTECYIISKDIDSFIVAFTISAPANACIDWFVYR
jgi:hypothetical protein